MIQLMLIDEPTGMHEYWLKVSMEWGMAALGSDLAIGVGCYSRHVHKRSGSSVVASIQSVTTGRRVWEIISRP